MHRFDKCDIVQKACLRRWLNRCRSSPQSSPRDKEMEKECEQMAEQLKQESPRGRGGLGFQIGNGEADGQRRPEAAPASRPQCEEE